MLLTTLLLACGDEAESPERTPPTVAPGAPQAGVAEGLVDFPVGAPLGGFTGRCNCFGNSGEADKRQSAYVVNFNPSAGVHTRPQITALWLYNGDQDLVMLQTHAIYAYDGFLWELGDRLTAATGHDVRGKIILSVNHSHNAPANWHKGMTWFLGGDRYNQEVFERAVTSMEEVALRAFDTMVPAAIGIGQAQDWDPDDHVYADRRDDNDELDFFEDIGPGKYKDPNLTVLRVDTADGDPMGLFYAFGMHGTALGQDNTLWSSDSSGGVDMVLQDQFDTPVVVGFMQHGGGDASPRGSDSGFANLETIGEYAVDPIMDLYEATPTSTDPIRLETVTRSIHTSRDDIHVTRNGTIDLYYAPWVDTSVETWAPDEEVWDDDGNILSPIDEFNTLYGGAFCGDDTPLIPGYGVDSLTYPYASCVNVESISWVIAGFFDLDPETEMTLPLEESEHATTTATRIGPLAIREPDGSEVSGDVLFGFFPGETTAMYTEQFRRRAEAELGYDHVIPIGYSQDHEGYLLIPEDWLQGGYEANINIWGPLQAEYIMEGLMDFADAMLSTDVLEPHDLNGDYEPSTYGAVELPDLQPDATPSAGTALTEIPDYLFSPLFEYDENDEVSSDFKARPDPVIERLELAQFAWEGGDPGVDLPNVVLEYKDGSDWVEATTTAGRVIDETLQDILLTVTPDPLYPFEDAQTHTWWAAWQAVDHVNDRAGLPVGTYRLHVYGKHYTGSNETWPWDTTDYEVTSDEFEVVEATVHVSVSEGTVSAWIQPPSYGFRLIDMEGSSTGYNPVRDCVLSWELDDGSNVDETPDESISSGMTHFAVTAPEGAVSLTVTDGYGNTGTVSL